MVGQSGMTSLCSLLHESQLCIEVSDKISGETLFLNRVRVVGTLTLSCDSSEVCRACDETENVSLSELGWSTWS